MNKTGGETVSVTDRHFRETDRQAVSQVISLEGHTRHPDSCKTKDRQTQVNGFLITSDRQSSIERQTGSQVARQTGSKRGKPTNHQSFIGK